MFSCALHWCVAWKITIFSSSVSREALRHAYEALKAADGNGVHFQDFLLSMEEFKPEICEKYHFLIWCIPCSQISVRLFNQPTFLVLQPQLALPV